MIEAIIFDFDGVVLDSEPLHYEACCQVLKPLNLTLSYKEYQEQYLGLADKEMFPKLMQRMNYPISKDEIKLLAHKKSKVYIDIITQAQTLPVIEGFQNFLMSIATKVKKLAICSGSTRNEIESALTKIAEGKLSTYFDTIVTTENVSQGKPSPEGYLLTAERINIKPEHCLVIEDTPHGIQAAKEAGMRVIGLLTSYKHTKLLKADKTISNFKQLLLEDVL
ncbi:HAD family hydrolase [Legionella sp. D16C41]|uniref:HAD family hydrolase n=1 Tax=Legionella sp. D16C41 TaxID=3402688 RepID=UPI003AF423D3